GSSCCCNVSETAEPKRRNNAYNTKVLWWQGVARANFHLMKDKTRVGRLSSPILSELPPWHECNFFCIHDYAGTGASPCGWRGRLEMNRAEGTEQQPNCPHCGNPTLFRLPSASISPLS